MKTQNEKRRATEKASIFFGNTYINNHVKNVGRNKDGKGHSDVSNRNEEHVIGQ